MNMMHSLFSERSVHEKNICRAFENSVYNGGAVFSSPLLLLAFTNRCGSNLLAGYLRSINGLSGFHEQLNFNTVIRTSKEIGISSFPDYFRYFDSKGKGYGYKASIQQIAMLYRLGISRMYPSVRVLHIIRNDTLAQAVSYSIADQTKQWTSEQKREGDPVFDVEDIDRRLAGVALQNDAIKIAAKVYNFSYARVVYEDIVRDPLRFVGKAAVFLGAKPPETLPEPRILAQYDAVNDEFIHRYKKSILLSDQI